MYCNIGGAEFVYRDENDGMSWNMVYGDSDWFTFKEIKNMNELIKKFKKEN